MWKVMDRVKKLCANPRMNLQGSNPFLPDVLQDIRQLICEIVSKYEENIGFLNDNECFKLLMENLQDKCQQTIRLFKDAKDKMYDEMSSYRHSLTRLSIIFHYALFELKALFPNGVYCGRFVIADAEAADFWLNAFQTR